MLTSSGEGHGFDPQSGQTKNYIVGFSSKEDNTVMLYISIQSNLVVSKSKELMLLFIQKK
jgi:hypothetical protein